MKGGAAGPHDDLKGHLGLRSSPLSPTSSKLMTQYVVLDHLNAHYRRVNNAKSAIDNKAPKAWTSCTKVRDRVRRNETKKRGGSRSNANSRPNSRMSIASNQSYADQVQVYEDYFDDDPEVGAIVKSTITHQHSQPNHDIYIERANTEDMKMVDRMVADSYNNPNTYRSPRPMKSMIPDTLKAGSGNPNVSTPRKGIAGDLLDDHAHRFKEGKPFTPRTLNTKNVQSKLSQFKYYNPPKKRSAGSKSGSKEIQEEKFERTETMNTMATTQDLTFEPLRSRDLSQLSSHRNKTANIPRLDISVDQDHMEWLNEQAKKAQVRVASARREEVKEERAAVSQSARLNHTSGLNGTSRMNYTGGLRTSDTMRSSGTYRDGVRASNITTASDALAREEELQYLEFVSDVTSDVLDRGIFTNRVLKQVFEHHIEQKKNVLKISRMRALLDKLRADLGIPESDGEAEEDFGLRSTVKMSDEEYHEDRGPPRAQPRVQTRHKFVKVTDEVDYKEPESSSQSFLKKPVEHVESSVTTKIEHLYISEAPKVTMPTDQGPSISPRDAVLNAVDEEDGSLVSEQNSVVSEQEGSVTSNLDEMSTTRSLPQEHKWMKDAANFTMTLKPGQLDMTLVKPKPRARDRQRLAETVPANPRARRRDLAAAVEEKDELGTTGEISSLTEVTAIGSSDPYKEDKFEVSSVASDATLKNDSEKGSRQASQKGSPHALQASVLAAEKGSDKGSVRGSRHGSPRGSERGSVASISHKAGAPDSPRGSVHRSMTSVKTSSHADEGLLSEQGSSGTLKESLEGSTRFVMAQTVQSAPWESPRASPRATKAESSQWGSGKGSQASVHTFEGGSDKNEAGDYDSVFSDHTAVSEHEHEESTKTVPSYAKKMPIGSGGDDDDDF